MKLFFLILILVTSLDSFAQFGEQQIITATALSARSVYSADLDGDGDMDILSASEGDEKIAWYENTDGLGNFGLQQIITESLSGIRSVFAIDLDGDEDIDVLATSGSGDKIVWYKNLDGLGDFSFEFVITNLTDGANSVFATDIDNDGDMDVLSSSAFDNKIAWYENIDGFGNFGTQQIITTNALSTRDVYAEDIDGDGDMDVIATSTGEAEVIWFENLDGQGTFGTENVITNNAIGVLSVFAIDIDGDNDLDVLAASTSAEKVAWYENIDGQGNFSAEKIITTSADAVWEVYATDLDNDNDIDVIASVAGEDKIVWYENLDGLGSFSDEIIITIETDSPRSVYASDIDNDGDMDVLSASLIDDKIAWYENLTILIVEDIDIENNISIYPNPVKNNLNITTNNKLQINQIQVYDILGKLLLQTRNTQQINVSHLLSGVLFVKIHTNKGVLIKKAMKE